MDMEKTVERLEGLTRELEVVRLLALRVRRDDIAEVLEEALSLLAEGIVSARALDVVTRDGSVHPWVANAAASALNNRLLEIDRRLHDVHRAYNALTNGTPTGQA